jgi:hypothetical protein
MQINCGVAQQDCHNLDVGPGVQYETEFLPCAEKLNRSNARFHFWCHVWCFILMRRIRIHLTRIAHRRNLLAQVGRKFGNRL